MRHWRAKRRYDLVSVDGNHRAPKAADFLAQPLRAAMRQRFYILRVQLLRQICETR
jgi:hypothetical protein